MKNFIQFDQNGEIQFVVKAEFEAVIPDEHKGRFIEIPSQKAQEIKEKLGEYKVVDGELIKKPPEATKPAENDLQPTIDQ